MVWKIIVQQQEIDMGFFKSKEKTIQENQSEKERLLVLTEKELMVEMILKLNEVSKKM